MGTLAALATLACGASQSHHCAGGQSGKCFEVIRVQSVAGSRPPWQGKALQCEGRRW